MHVHVLRTVSLIASLLISTAASAAEKTVSGTIDAVDTVQQTITVGRQKCDVIRKTEIALNGKTATLFEVKAGRQATVKYDDVLDVATSIVVHDAEQPSPRSNNPRVHYSTAVNRHAEDSKSNPRYRIDQTQLDTKEWQRAIEKALQHQSGRGCYTLMRVTIDDTPAKGEQIQAQATKLKDFTEEYNGAGGEYRVISSGEFLLWEHINSTRRKDDRDPLRLGSVAHGRSDLWVDVPKNGVLNVLGDVILNRCPEEEMGTLGVKIYGLRGLNTVSMMVGPVVVGGPYGKTYRFETAREFEVRLPPGDYKILLPDFDMIKSRWDVSIAPKDTTRLVFDVTVQLRSGAAPSNPNEP